MFSRIFVNDSLIRTLTASLWYSCDGRSALTSISELLLKYSFSDDSEENAMCGCAFENNSCKSFPPPYAVATFEEASLCSRICSVIIRGKSWLSNVNLLNSKVYLSRTTQSIFRIRCSISFKM